MKKTFLLLLSFFCIFSMLQSQTLVTTEVQQKNAVLEEYTGIHCTYCPEGHAIAQALQNANPGRVTLINIHQGSFAVPSGSEPDFRTIFGDALAAQTGLTGYPSGTVNRHVFPGLSSGNNTALGRSAWVSAAGIIFGETTPVNVGANSSYNAETRELTVNVELYYTANSPQATNFINVALTENGILGPQTGGGMGNNYVHNHMLRWLITDQWGDEITETTQGSFVQRTYTYTVPEDFVTENCDISVFVTETHQEIYNGVTIPAINGTTLPIANVTLNSNAVMQAAPFVPSIFSLNFESLLEGNEIFNLELNTNAPEDWSYSFVIDGVTYTTTANVPLTNSDIEIVVQPGVTPAFPTFTLSVTSQSFPSAPEIIKSVSVISNVTDLLVHNQGSWAGGVPADFEDEYFDGLATAGNVTHAAAEYSQFLMAADYNALSQVRNIYFNVAWSFPGLTDQNVAVLAEFMDNGGNLFIAGQDLGWDTWEADGNGTDATKAFYTNYLHADYVADGSPTNNNITAVATDPYFGTISTSTLVNVYGGSNMYPDEINPADASAVGIFYYVSNPAKKGALRIETDTYKAVYSGFDPAMVSNQTVRNQILAATHDYFYAPIAAFAMVTTPLSSAGSCDAQATVNVYSGVEPFDYLWNDNNAQTSQVATGLCAGTYEVTVTDNNGNQITASVTVPSAAVLEVDVEVVNASCETCSDGSATVTVTGGSGDYSYLWNDNNAQTTATATNLAAGEYTVIITDNEYNIEVTRNVVVDFNVGINNSNIESLIRIYPNPANEILQIKLDREIAENAKVEIFTINGMCIFANTSNSTNNISVNVENFANGIYILKITTSKGVANKKLQIVR